MSTSSKTRDRHGAVSESKPPISRAKGHRSPRCDLPRGWRVSRIAEAWNCSTDFVYALISTGKLRALRLPGKGRRAGALVILEKDLREFVERHLDSE